ncbi:MAG: nucleotide exchange factor GrpE [Wenzhouxiangellaceae bacterium]|nr:nucleotide exchange factor GrpE [Wenzhouxiangellaceae bacterium]
MSRQDDRQEAEQVHDQAPESEAEPVVERTPEEERDAAPAEAGTPGPAEAAEASEKPGDERAAADEVVQLKEAMLRMRADMDNREKRLEREMARARKFALESLMRDLVPVLDSIDQALASVDADAGAAREGMELTRKQAIDVLARHGLEVLDPVGERFDPTWHEAMTTQQTSEQEPDTVAQVLQKGYSLNGRLIRPARVIVAKAP